MLRRIEFGARGCTSYQKASVEAKVRIPPSAIEANRLRKCSIGAPVTGSISTRKVLKLRGRNDTERLSRVFNFPTNVCPWSSHRQNHPFNFPDSLLLLASKATSSQPGHV